MFDEDNNNNNRVKKVKSQPEQLTSGIWDSSGMVFWRKSDKWCRLLTRHGGVGFDINESQEAVESFNSFWNGTAGGDGGRVVTVQSRSNNPPLARLNPQIHPTRSRHIFYFLPHPLSLSLSWCGVYIYGKLWSNST